MRTTLAVSAAALALASVGGFAAINHPNVEITNGLIRAKIYLPDARRGFYQGTRFDWSGVIYSLTANGHDYYGPWFNKTDPAVHDFVYRGEDIVAGPCSAITGPVDEFAPVGYDEAKVGGTFLKIGVGALRKASADKYDNYRVYEITDGGTWSVQKSPDKLEFTQDLNDMDSGFAYVYKKTLRLTENKRELVLEHHLKNTGKRVIQTNVYNHNFLVLDGKGPGPGVTISLPFLIQPSKEANGELAQIRGRDIHYLKTLVGKDVFATRLDGFGSSPDDHQIQVENNVVRAGVRWRCDRPLLRESLWSIRSVTAVEPFVAITIEPSSDFAWTTSYEYYALSGAGRGKF